MFAYCGNNPTNRFDRFGCFWTEFFEEFIKTIQEAQGYFVTAAGISQVDTAAPGPADVIAGAMVVGGILVCTGLTLGSTLFADSKTKQNTKAEEKAEAMAITKSTKDPVLFPVDPNQFNPLGLIKVIRPGTKNGMIISWMDPINNTEIFRWDANLNYANGPHYHILGEGHYYPGEVVPEPFASIFFPGQ